MTIQTVLAVIAWVFSVVAIAIAGRASKQANETESLVWRTKKEYDESRLRENLQQDRLSHRVYALEKRVVYLENQLAEEKDCEPCRPRSCVGMYGDNMTVFWKQGKHKVGEHCDGCDNQLRCIGGDTKYVCRLDLKCADFKKKGE